MSYILDALKKSEQERKLGHLPDLSSDHLPIQRQESTPFINKLSIFTGVLVACLLLVFIYLYIEKNTAAIKQSQATLPGYDKQTIQNPKHLDLTNTAQQNFPDRDTGTFDKKNPDVENEMEIIRPSQSRREQLIKQKQTEQNQDAALKKKYEQYFQATEEKPAQARETETQQENIRDGAKRRMQEAMQSSDQTSLEQSSDQTETKNTEKHTIQETVPDNENENINPETLDKEQAQQRHWEDYPSIAELSPDMQAQLPALHVSTHIFSNAESFRKVTINEQSAKKGAELSQGLFLEKITEEGVILSFKDVWFRMKALENWQN